MSAQEVGYILFDAALAIALVAGTMALVLLAVTHVMDKYVDMRAKLARIEKEDEWPTSTVS